MYDVFVSYARSDEEPAIALIHSLFASLAKLELRVFFDSTDIEVGADFADTIDVALRGSKAVVGCWSTNYFLRHWCLVESRFAAHSQPSNLVPVAVGPLKPEELPADLRFLNFVDLTGWTGDAKTPEWQRVVQRLEALLERNLTVTHEAVLTNDDVVSAELVLESLVRVFGLDRTKAWAVIFTAHERGEAAVVTSDGSNLDGLVARGNAYISDNKDRFTHAQHVSVPLKLFSVRPLP